MDLAAWWQARRWRALLELIEQLPAASRLKEAVYNDPEQARMIALAREYRSPDEPEPDPWSPSVREYDLHATILREVLHAVVAVHGALVGKASTVTFPAPRTEIDRQVELIVIESARRTGARYGFSPEDFS